MCGLEELTISKNQGPPSEVGGVDGLLPTTLLILETIFPGSSKRPQAAVILTLALWGFG